MLPPLPTSFYRPGADARTGVLRERVLAALLRDLGDQVADLARGARALLRAATRGYRRARLRREVLARLEPLDDRLLDDIGLERARLRDHAERMAEVALRRADGEAVPTPDHRRAA